MKPILDNINAGIASEKEKEEYNKLKKGERLLFKGVFVPKDIQKVESFKI